IEAELVFVINDKEKLTSQLEEARLASSRYQEELEEYKQELREARRQLREVETMYDLSNDTGSIDSRGGNGGTIVAQLNALLVERDQQIDNLNKMVEVLRSAEIEKDQTIESVMAMSRAANDRSERLQVSFDEALEELKLAQDKTAELETNLRSKSNELQSQIKRADRFEQMWKDANAELKALRSVVSMQEKSETRERQLASLKRDSASSGMSGALNDGSTLPPPNAIQGDGEGRPESPLSITGSVNGGSVPPNRELQRAYLNAQRQCADARDKVLSIKQELREQTELRRELEQRYNERDRQVKDLRVRFDAFSHLIADAIERQRGAGDGGKKPADATSTMDLSRVELDVNALLTLIRNPLTSSLATLQSTGFDENMQSPSDTSSTNSPTSPSYHSQARPSWTYEFSGSDKQQPNYRTEGTSDREPLRPLAVGVDHSTSPSTSTPSKYSVY
ncbi:hypothetical protein EV182_005162, partial [Spiromyces aspiralis]